MGSIFELQDGLERYIKKKACDICFRGSRGIRKGKGNK